MATEKSLDVGASLRQIFPPGASTGPPAAIRTRPVAQLDTVYGHGAVRAQMGVRTLFLFMSLQGPTL